MKFKIPGWRLYLLFIWIILGVGFLDYLNETVKLIFIIGTIAGVFWAGFGTSDDLEKTSQKDDKTNQKEVKK